MWDFYPRWNVFSMLIRRVLPKVPGRDSACAAIAALLLLAPVALLAQIPAVTVAPGIKTFAGNGTVGMFGGDGGPATGAELYEPTSVAVDSAGNLYIADTYNQAIRKVAAASGVISTVAGIGGVNNSGYSGDGGPATSALLNYPYGIAVDASGNLYIADTFNYVIRRVDASTGVITTVAGNGTSGYLGDGGPATSAELNTPYGIAVDAKDNLYIADSENHVIRRVDAATGVISTIAGDGTYGYSGDGGLATGAELNRPFGVALDAAGNIYIADTDNARVRRVDASTGIITTVAGGGIGGDGGPATSAALGAVYGVALDAAGNLYISVATSVNVRYVSAATGVIVTIAGNGTPGFAGDGGPATSAELSDPWGVAVDSLGNLYIGDTANQRVREVPRSGNQAPVSFAATGAGSFTTPLNVLLSINTSLTISGISVPQSLGGNQEFAVGAAQGCAVDGVTNIAAGTICIVPITFQPAYPGLRQMPLVVQTSQGTFQFGLEGIGEGAQVAFLPGVISTVAPIHGYPAGVTPDSAGNLYLPSLNYIYKVDSTGAVTIVAGNGVPGFSGDGGQATSAALYSPFGVAVDAAGNLYIADTYNQRVRRVDAGSGVITTVAGNGTAGYAGDNGPATAAELNFPWGVALDATGNLYISDTSNARIRKVDSSGVITTVAGNGTSGYGGDGGPATSAMLAGPAGIAVDSAGNLYIADRGGSRVRKVDGSGIITTAAGTGSSGYSGDGGPATSAELSEPSGVAVDSAANLYIADTNNLRTRKVEAATGIISTVAGNGAIGYSGDGGPATAAELNYPLAIGVDGAGTLFVADSTNSALRKITAAAAPVVFPATNVGVSSSAQLVTLADIGNEAANITSFVASTNFGVDAGTTTCAAYSAVAVGGSCTLGVVFNPTTTGSLPGTLSVTDTAVNGFGSQQIPLLGTGQLPAVSTSTLLNANPSAPVYGQGITLTAQITWAQPNGTPTGTVAFYDGATLLGSAGLSSITSSSAQAVLSLNPTALAPGSHSLQAAYSGDANYLSSSGSLNLAVAAYGTATTVKIVSGSPQTALVNTGYTASLTAGVVDQFNNPVPGVTVTFTAPGTGASATLSSATASTDNNGQAAVTATGNAIAGSYNVTASISAGATASFGLTNLTGTAQNIGSACLGTPSGLISWWPAEGNGNDIISGNNGTLQNGATFAPGEVGQAFSVSNGAYVDVPDAPQLNPSAAMSVSVWVRATSFGSFNAIMKKIDTTQTNGYALEMVNGQGPVAFYVYLNTTGWVRATSTTTLQLNTWYHIVGTYDGAQLKLYLNGRLEGTSGVSGSITTAKGDLNLGRDPGNPTDSGRFWNGLIDEAQIYNRALTASEVSSLYNTPPSAAMCAPQHLVTPIGSSSSANLVYSFASGMPDFALKYAIDFHAAAPSCTGTGPVTCTLPVTFQPKYPGLQTDAVVVTDGSGNVLQTTLLSGIGQGPQVALLPGVISTVAGDGNATYTDGIPATSTGLDSPDGIAVDPAGNLFIADLYNFAIRRVDAATGIISTAAGNGTAGYSGDGGPATSAELNYPSGVAVDGAGNLYIADTNNHRIRKVSSAAGLISTVAGNGTAGYSGDGGPAASAELSYPTGVAVDAAGNLYIADINNQRIRKVDAATGVITTVAGNGVAGYSGDGGPATSAELQYPYGIRVDGNSNLYIADTNNQRIRRVDSATGVITTAAGDGTAGYSGDGGPATSAGLNSPYGVGLDAAGNLYISDVNNQRIRRVDSAIGFISTLAGNGTRAYTGDGGPATSAGLPFPIAVTPDVADKMYVSDGSNRVRSISSSGAPLTFPTTAIGSSSAAQTITVSNVGNASLIFSSFAASANFTLDATTTTCSTSMPLATGRDCTVGVIFTPTTSGSFSGTLTVTDNALNVSGTTQQVQLSGQSALSTTTTLSASPGTPIYGEAMTLTATITWTQSAGPTPTGTVTFYNGAKQLGSGSLTQISSTTAQASLALSANQVAVGSNSIQATYSGDTNYQGSSGTLTLMVAAYGNAATISAVSGTPQVAPVQMAFPAALTVQVTDLYNNPVPGVSVTFTAPGTGASATLSSTPATTGNDGQAVVTATANAIAGRYTVTASLSGGASASFALTNLTGTAQSLSTVAVGSSASMTLWYTFTNPSSTPNFNLRYGLEFSLGAPNCTGTGTVTCSVTVTFQPQYAGLRTDAVVVTNGSGNMLQTTLLSGIGQGPQVALLPGVMSTVAGNGTAGYSGDGGLATSAQLNYPGGVVRDVAGNLYIADTSNGRVRKVDAVTGLISTVAQLPSPLGLALDGAGNLYVAENGFIRKVDTLHETVTTVAGNGTYGYSGDGGPATSAQFGYTFGIAVDATGNLYIADYSNNRIRKVDATSGIVTTVVGNGISGFGGDGGPALNAELNNPRGITLDAAGNLYIADSNNERIRFVNMATGVISTAAGNGGIGFGGDGGPATSATLNAPLAVAADGAGDLYILDFLNQRIRKLDSATGVITTIVGNGTAGYSGDGGPATSAELNNPYALALDSQGNLFIADYSNSVVREVSTASAPFSFPPTNVGSQSVAQTVTVSNIGNNSLSFSSLSASANFTVDVATTTCSTSTPLAAGRDCTLGVIFAPTTGGNLSGTFTVADNAFNVSGATQQVQLTGTGTIPPGITNANTASFTVGTAGSFTMTATGFPAPTWSETGTLPNGITFDASTGLLSGTPAGGTGGVYPITFTASNIAGSVTQNFILSVMDFSLGSIPAITVPTGGSQSTTVSINPVAGFSSAIGLTATGLPTGVTVSFSPASVAPSGSTSSSNLTVNVSPALSPQTFTFTVTAAAGTLSHSTTATVNVSATTTSVSNVIGMLLSGGSIANSGMASALSSKLSASQSAVSAGSLQAAVNTLAAFQNQVNAQAGKQIAASSTIGGVTFNPVTTLLADAQALIDSLKVSTIANPVTGYVVNSSGLDVSGAVVAVFAGSSMLATATTDITGFYYFPTTGVLGIGSTYTIGVTGFPPGFTTSTPASQTFTWDGSALTLGSFVLN